MPEDDGDGDRHVDECVDPRVTVPQDQQEHHRDLHDGLELAQRRRRDRDALLLGPIRRTVTANSRAMITMATHASRRSSETSESSAPMISSLSATGSISLPNVVTPPASARGSRRRVGERGDGEDDRRQHVAVGRLVEQRDDEHRHQEDAQHRQHVGRVHRNIAPSVAARTAIMRRLRFGARRPARDSEAARARRDDERDRDDLAPRRGPGRGR